MVHDVGTFVGEVAMWIASAEPLLERPLMYSSNRERSCSGIDYTPLVGRSLEAASRLLKLSPRQELNRYSQFRRMSIELIQTRRVCSSGFVQSGSSAHGSWIATVNLVGQQIGWTFMSAHAIVPGGALSLLLPRKTVDQEARGYPSSRY